MTRLDKLILTLFSAIGALAVIVALTDNGSPWWEWIMAAAVLVNAINGPWLLWRRS